MLRHAFALAAILLALMSSPGSPALAAASDALQPMDVFQLEWASDPQVSPDGKQIVYVRNFMDVMHDRTRSNLWIVDVDGKRHRPLTTGSRNDGSPRWSPDGTRLLYTSSVDGSSQLWLRFMDDGTTARLTQLTQGPGSLTWSPDGSRIAFSMRVPSKPESFVALPAKPEGARWAEPARVIRKVQYRADGARGFVRDGFTQLFVLSADGGTPQQVTSGDFHHGSRPSWSPDGKSLIFSANREEDWEYDPRDNEIYELPIGGGEIRALTDRQGPDHSPTVSPDGKWIAYLGYDDRYQGYQVTKLYLMKRDGSGSRVLTADLDRSVNAPRWAADGKGLYFRYSDHGNSRVAHVDLSGKVTDLARDLGGTSLGRPYGGGSFSVSDGGVVAYTHTRPDYPADVAVARRGGDTRLLTRLNEDLFSQRTLGEVEELRVKSSFDGREIQGWIAKPPHFDPSKKYPLILEIHGGPFADYGDRFASEIQLFAAAGYVVLYVNPRGSTSYGEEFGNLIHHAYPGNDYDDLMSAVDGVIAKGYVDPKRLFVTGGSGGGVLTSWIVGKTDRFKGAVVAKPVINWYSFALTADMYATFYKYWFPGFPWDHTEHYMKRSPISLVGNVTTPTMLLTGEEDYRTPMSESEQYYQALKLRKVETALVRIPGASHGIARRPSNLISKVLHILKWFELHDPAAAEED